MSRKFTLISGVMLLSILSIVAFGCQSDGQNAAEDNELVIYSGRSNSLVAPLIDQFEAQNPDLTVEVRYADSNLLAATLIEEDTRTEADLFFSQEVSALLAVRNLLTEIPQSVLDSVPSWAYDDSRLWVGTSGRVRTVVYDSDRLSESDLPDSIEDFIDQRWRGMIGWAPTNSSFQAMIAVMLTEWGEERTRAWLDGIVANEPTEYPKNTPIVNAVADGEVSVGFVNHYYAQRVSRERNGDSAAVNKFLEVGDPGAALLVAGVGVLDENNPNAQDFMEFLLSDTAQEYLALEVFEISVTGAASSPGNPTADSFVGSTLYREELIKAQELLRDTGVLP